jgi:hypothetical protein
MPSYRVLERGWLLRRNAKIFSPAREFAHPDRIRVRRFSRMPKDLHVNEIA